MKKPLFVVSVIGMLAMALLSGGTYAADPATNPLTHDPKIQERFENQQKRINEAVKAGSLTQEEAAQVQDNLNRIKDEEAKLKAASQLTVEAKKRLHHKLDLNSKMIEAEKKNPIVQISPNPASPAAATNPLTHDPKIQERFENQQKRINEAVKAGSLTQEEAAQVQDNLNRIKDEEAKLKAASQLTVEAKKRLHHKLDLNSKMIEAEKKNPIVQISPNPASPALPTQSATSPAAVPTPNTTPPVAVPTPSTPPPAAAPIPGTTPPAASLPVPSTSTPEDDLKRGTQERGQDGHRDMGRRHMSKEEHERMKAERKAEREKRKAERKARHHERDKDDHDDEDKDDDKDDEKGHDRDDHDKGKKKGKHGRERD